MGEAQPGAENHEGWCAHVVPTGFRSVPKTFGLCETLPTSSGVAQGCRLARRARMRAQHLLGQGMPGLRDLGGCVEQPQAAHSRPGEGLGGLRGAQATARRLPRRSFVPQACRTIGAGLVKGSSAPSPPANGDAN